MVLGPATEFVQADVGGISPLFTVTAALKTEAGACQEFV